jgi:hypothetical protein
MRSKHIIFFFLLGLLFSCRYNKVSIIVENVSPYKFKTLTVRFGDTLQIFKDLPQGARTKRFFSNQTYGKGFTKVVLPSEDTIVYFPLSLRGEKVYYKEKILVKINIIKTPDQRDTIVIKTRKRFLF